MLYHKIQSIYKRDARGAFIDGEWSRPELEYLSSLEWEFTEKVDGTNIRLILDHGDFRLGGRTDRAQLPGPLVQKFMDTDIAARVREHFGPDASVVLYGEGYGPKIQKVGGNYRQDQDFVLFDVKVGDFWLRREDVEAVALAVGVDVVPIVGHGTLYDAMRLVENGLQSEWGNFEAEGVVCRPVVQLFNRTGKRIIVKVKARDMRRMRRNSNEAGA